jgi:hypothetical protein
VGVEIWPVSATAAGVGSGKDDFCQGLMEVVTKRGR